jgi:putative transposase
VEDVTYIPTREGWLYLAILMDLCLRKIVGWSDGEHNDRHRALRALHMGFRNRRMEMELVPPEGYSTREEAHRSIFEYIYIEGFYTTWRKHSSLGFLSPDEYERRLSVQA